MCGIAGYIHKKRCSYFCNTLATKVHELQACRGPDNYSTTSFENESWTAHFYHQHLRVADLNPLANQPMRSKTDNAFSIIFNGEIYNHGQLKSNIGHKLLTHSDTEVLIELLAKYGTLDTLKKIRGMFAWATINERTSIFEIVRDRFGEKPLHFVKQPNEIFFSSQHDSATYFLKKINGLEVDQNALGSYLILGYVPYRQSLFKGIEKLSPGGKLTLNLRGKNWAEENQSRWIEPFEVRDTRNHTPDELEEVLRKAVREQLEADVPVGLFLSGGVDSSLISVLAQQEHQQSVHSFSIGFEKEDFDESNYALGVSQVIGTTHHAHVMTSKDANLILEKVTRAFSEPLGDPSVFPTTFVSQLAREHVTVCLTGDGADELFFGYGRYSRFQFLESALAWGNKPISLAFRLSRIRSGLPHLFGAKSARLNGILESGSSLETYLSLVGFGHISKFYTDFGLTLENAVDDSYLIKEIRKPSINWMREFDLDTYLTDDILVKVDRAAMVNSLETRAPYLDSRVVSIAETLGQFGTSRPTQKYFLKKIVSKYIPSGQFDRKKQGFGAPLGDWFRTTLKEWSHSIWNETNWESLGLETDGIDRIWKNLQKSDKPDASFEWLLLSLGSSISKAQEF